MSKNYGKYTDLVTTLDEAYRAFAHHYALKNPPPEKPIKKRSWMPGLKFSMFLVMIGSQIISAFHSVPEIAAGIKQIENEELKYLLVLSTFLMLETAVIVYSYFRTKRQFEISGEDTSGLDLRIKIGLGLSLFILVAANLNSSLKANAAGLEWLTSLINITIGVCAPILALVSGDVLAMLRVGDAKREGELERRHETKMSKWRKALNHAWALEKKSWGAKVSIVRPEVSLLPGQPEDVRPLLSARTDTDGQNHSTGQGYDKRTDAKDIVRKHIQDNPDALSANVRQLAQLLNVGKTTVSDVQRELRERTNGHANGLGVNRRDMTSRD